MDENEANCHASDIRGCKYPDRDAGRIGELDLPDQSRVIVITRGEESIIVSDDDVLEQDDRVLMVAHRDNLEKLKKRFAKMEEGQV